MIDMICQNCGKTGIEKFSYGWFGSNIFRKACIECKFERKMTLKEIGELADEILIKSILNSNIAI